MVCLITHVDYVEKIIIAGISYPRYKPFYGEGSEAAFSLNYWAVMPLFSRDAGWSRKVAYDTATIPILTSLTLEHPG